MITLKEIGTAQTFKFIPRVYTADSMVVKCEATGVSTTFSIAPTLSTYYLSVTETLDLKEGNTYTLKVYNGTDIVYYDRIFCTNQTITEYTINKDEYIQHSTDNEFIILQ